MKTTTKHTPVNWIPLPDAITEPQVKLKLKWSADERTRRSVLRQAKLMGFKTPTACLQQLIAATIAGNEEDTIITNDVLIEN